MRVSPSSLRINSLLAALKDDPDSDVIDALSYFLLPALDRVKGRPVTARLIAKAANGLYGWRITESIGAVFVERLVARGSIKIEERGGKTLYIAQETSDLGVSADSDTQRFFDEAVILFKQFDIISGDLLYSQLSEDELGQMLVKFLVSLESYTNEGIAAGAAASYTSSEKTSELDPILDAPVALKREEAHVCARFVSHLNLEHPEIAKNLSVFAAAGMLAELVEDFRKPTSVESRSNTTFFLDGPLLLSLVGVSGKASQDEAQNVILALKSIGCHIEVFSESCREAERVLSAYLKASPADRHGRTHSAVLNGETTVDYVKAVLADIEGAAERFKVSVRDYDLGSFPNSHRHFGNDRNTDIYSYLAWENPRAREHDAFCVTATMRLRAGRHRSDPLKVSHVMITTNDRLARKARDYCIESQLINYNQCGPIIDIRDAATIAWLRTGFADSERVPLSYMLAQCEKVLTIKKDVIEAARSKMKSLAQNKQEEFDLLLQNGRAVNFLMDYNRGSADNLADGDAEALLNSMLAAAIEISIGEKQKVIIEKDRLLREERRKSSQAVREHANQVEKFTSHQNELAKRIEELERIKTRSEDELLTVRNQRKEILQKGARSARKVANFIHIIFVMILAVLTVLASFGVIWPEIARGPKIALGALTIVGLIYTVLTIMGWSAPGLNRVPRTIERLLFRNYCLRRGIPKDIIDAYSIKDNAELLLSNKRCE